jgi:hypothetical protein
MPPGFLLDQVRSSKPAPPIVTEPRKRKACSDHIPAISALLRDLKTHPKAKLCSKLGLNWAEIEEKVEAREYESAYEFALDVRKMWTAAFKRFPAGSSEYISTVELSDFFEQSLAKKKDNEGKRPATEEVKEECKVRPLTLHEKQLLAASIRRLDKHYLRRIVEIVSGSKGQQTYTEEFEFDIDQLPPKIARELETYVQQCMLKQTNTPVLQGNEKAEDAPRPESSSSSSSSSDSEEDNGNPQCQPCPAAIH